MPATPPTNLAIGSRLPQGQAYIYGLAEPSSGQVRYIGKSIDARARLHHHWHERSATGDDKSRWLHQLSEAGTRPSLQILAVCDEEEWAQAEKALIARYRQQGNLLNHLDGGNGASRGGGISTGANWLHENASSSRVRQCGAKMAHARITCHNWWMCSRCKARQVERRKEALSSAFTGPMIASSALLRAESLPALVQSRATITKAVAQRRFMRSLVDQSSFKLASSQVSFFYADGLWLMQLDYLRDKAAGDLALATCNIIKQASSKMDLLSCEVATVDDLEQFLVPESPPGAKDFAALLRECALGQDESAFRHWESSLIGVRSFADNAPLKKLLS